MYLRCAFLLIKLRHTCVLNQVLFKHIKICYLVYGYLNSEFLFYTNGSLVFSVFLIFCFMISCICFLSLGDNAMASLYDMPPLIYQVVSNKSFSTAFDSLSKSWSNLTMSSLPSAKSLIRKNLSYL